MCPGCVGGDVSSWVDAALPQGLLGHPQPRILGVQEELPRSLGYKP